MEETPQGLAAAAATREALKRKREAEANGKGAEGAPEAKRTAPVPAPAILSHEVVALDGYENSEVQLSPELHGTMNDPKWMGPMAKEYPFKLDNFQSVAIACLERRECVLVAAHTSAGKTAVAEYAIAMAFRDKQKVAYTSPLKALSNQKYRELDEEFKDVGLMTGDVSINPNANALVMTTEILRSMLYRGSEILREVAWVIFDEVHYMQARTYHRQKDRERGVVWEEIIIFLPKEIKMVFLSATLSNASQFAAWVAHLRKQPCHVVYTDYRPTPLQHYGFPLGGNGLFLIKDEAGNFREENFNTLHSKFKEAEAAANGAQASEPAGGGGRFKGRGRGRDRGRGRGGRGGRGNNKKGSGDIAGDIIKILKLVKMRQLEPVIIFSFARRECENYATKTEQAKLDFTDDDEKEQIQLVFDNALKCLSEEDRNLSAISYILPILKSGVGVHHSGLLPILKELVELLFQEGLIKVLFATETFAMGLNMPARTVVFTVMQKWDGEQHRFMSSGEYIQMSGRAGRRGKDDRGLCIMMMDDQLTAPICREIVMGKPSPLLSSFKLSYYTLLNLMRRLEGSGQDMEYVIKRSFQQFQHESSLPKLKDELKQLEEESAGIKVTSDDAMYDYVRIRKEIAEKEAIILAEMLRPERCLQFLRPGRLIRVRDGQVDWGWGVLVSVVRAAPKAALGVLPPPRDAALPAKEDPDAHAEAYVLDTLLICAKGSGQEGVPKPPGVGQEAEMNVVPLPLRLVTAISTLRISIPGDLRPEPARRAALLTVLELKKRNPDGIPRLDPIDDFQIKEPRVNAAVYGIERLEKELANNAVFKLEQDSTSKVGLGIIERKAALAARTQELHALMRDSQLATFRTEARNRTAVLRRLGHVSADGIVLTKGRAACEIDTADELLTTELMFNGVFNSLDKHQLVALASCLIPMGEKSAEQIRLKRVLATPLQQLQETARHIAEVSNECKVEVLEDEYIQSFQPILMDVIYAWSKGASFETVCEMTDLFEGNIIRATRRLDELMNQLCCAARVIGDEELAKTFEESGATIRRDIMFAASLYI